MGKAVEMTSRRGISSMSLDLEHRTQVALAPTLVARHLTLNSIAHLSLARICRLLATEMQDLDNTLKTLRTCCFVLLVFNLHIGHDPRLGDLYANDYEVVVLVQGGACVYSPNHLFLGAREDEGLPSFWSALNPGLWGGRGSRQINLWGPLRVAATSSTSTHARSFQRRRGGDEGTS